MFSKVKAGFLNPFCALYHFKGLVNTTGPFSEIYI